MNIHPVQLVVTGHDETGKAVVTSNSVANNVFHRDHRAVALTDLWQILAVPANLDADGTEDIAGPFSIPPNKGGIKLRVVQFDPEPEGISKRTDGDQVFEEMGSGANHQPSARHPFMHRTQTLDFGIVLSGSITMLLDDDDIEVSAGTVVIQRGTNHAWSNRGSEPCRIAFVLVDAQHDDSIETGNADDATQLQPGAK